MHSWALGIGGLLLANAAASSPVSEPTSLQRSVAATTSPPSAYLASDDVALHACGEGEGIDAEGVIRWQGGDARHVYVVDPERALPQGVLDLALPAGTLWRLDSRLLGPSFRSGLVYGSVPTGSRQVWPLEQAPPLQTGHAYLLFVLADVRQPLASCIFEAT